MKLSPLTFIRTHPGTVAGWYQQAAGAIAAIACVPLIMRHLGNEKTGIWLSFQALTAMSGLADFGFGYVTSRQVAFSIGGGGTNYEISADIDKSQKGWQGVVNTLSMARRLNIWSCLVAFSLMASLGLYVTHSPHFQILPPMKLLATWYLLGSSLILLMLGKPDFAVLEGGGYLPLSRIIVGTQMLINGLGAATYAALGGELTGMAAITVVGTSAGTLTLHYCVQRILSRQPVVAPAYTPIQLRKLACVAFPIGALNLGSYCFSSVQVPIIALTLSPSLVAPFYIAQRCGQFLNTAVMQFLFPRLPQFSSLLGAGDLREAKNAMRVTLVKLSVLSALTALIFYISMPWIYCYLFKVKPLSYELILIMAVDYFLLNCTVSCAQFVLAGGRNPFVIATIINGALNLLLIYYLTARLGIIGVPLASLVTGISCSYWFCLSKGYSLYARLSPRT